MAHKRAATGSGGIPALSENAFKSVIQSNDDLAKLAAHTLSELPPAKQMELGYIVSDAKKVHTLVSVLLENSNNESESSVKKVLSAIDDAGIVRNPVVLKRQFDSLKVERHFYNNDTIPNDRVFKYMGHTPFSSYTEQIEGHNVKFFKYNGSPLAIESVKKFLLEDLKVQERYIKSFGNELYCAFITQDFPLAMMESAAVDIDDD